jgi:hypothetical protein
MNTITKVVSVYRLECSCWADFNGLIYFAAGDNVSKAWTGTTDAGTPITGSVLQAYSPLGSRGKKKFPSFVRISELAGSAQISLALDADFKTFDGETIFTYAPPSRWCYLGCQSVGCWSLGWWCYLFRTQVDNCSRQPWLPAFF